jgi:hypothetical protein
VRFKLYKFETVKILLLDAPTMTARRSSLSPQLESDWGILAVRLFPPSSLRVPSKGQHSLARVSRPASDRWEKRESRLVAPLFECLAIKAIFLVDAERLQGMLSPP